MQREAEAFAELKDMGAVELLMQADAAWIGEVTVPRDPVRAAIALQFAGGVSVSIGPSFYGAGEQMLPELRPGKFRVVCFALRTGDASGPTQRDV